MGTGAIHDLGYQRYSGARLGHGYAVWTLFAHSMRSAFGLSRGARAKLVPLFVTTLVVLPAVAQMAVASAIGTTDMVSYSGHLSFTALLLALFVAAQAPELLSTDRQFGVLPLYLARPLDARDYIGAKFAAMLASVLLLSLGPQLFLFTSKILASSTPWSAFTAELPKLGPIVGGTFVISMFMASVGLLLSSFARVRANASASVLAFFLFMPAASELIRGASTGQLRRYAPLANPMTLMTGFVNWLFDVQAGRRSAVTRAALPGEAYLYAILAVTVVCLAVLYFRYRKAER